MSASQSDNAGLLHTYLNDHLAGSVAALELIEHLTEKFPGTELEKFLADLYAEIEADQQVLRDLLQAFEKNESAIRKAGAWVAEKFGRAKFAIGANDVSGVGLVEALEALTLGITGKQLLWRALSVASEVWPALQLRVIGAAEQRDRVDVKRLQAARQAFAR